MATDNANGLADFSLQHDSMLRLVLIDAQGLRHVGVEPVRVFPITDPEHWISICDAEGREIACLEDLAKLPEATRQVLEEELKRRDFIPQIRRIQKVSGNDPSEWDVATDRGPTVFLLKTEDNIRRLGTDRVLIVDAHGIRYLIPDVRRLDAHSRRILERYL